MNDKELQNEIKILLDYLSDNLTSRDRYLFERKVECDAFDQEAIDGCLKISPSEVKQDLNTLRRGASCVRSKCFLWVSLAIFIVVFIVMACLFFPKLQSPKHVSSSPIKSAVQVPAPEPKADSVLKETFQEPVVTDTVVSVEESPKVEEQVSTGVKIPVPSPEKYNEVINYKGRIVDAESKKPIQWAEVSVHDSDRKTITKGDGTFSIDLAGSTTPCFIVKFRNYMDTEFVLSESNSETILMKPKSEGSAEPIESIFAGKKNLASEPQPEGGMAKFKKYLAANLVYPQDVTNPTEQTVEVNFLVKPTGQPINFEVTSSPGRAFTTETMRVISRGPWWYPAKIDGNAVMGDVSLTVVFKPHAGK